MSTNHVAPEKRNELVFLIKNMKAVRLECTEHLLFTKSMAKHRNYNVATFLHLVGSAALLDFVMRLKQRQVLIGWLYRCRDDIAGPLNEKNSSRIPRALRQSTTNMINSPAVLDYDALAEDLRSLHPDDHPWGQPNALYFKMHLIEPQRVADFDQALCEGQGQHFSLSA